MVLVNCVMVNMILAIVMDVYSSVKDSMGDDVEAFPTIWSQTYEILRRWHQNRRGQRLHLHHILMKLHEHDESCYVMSTEVADGYLKSKRLQVSLFVQLVPGLPRAQAERLLVKAMEYARLKSKPEGSISTCLTQLRAKLRALDLRVQQVQEIAEEVNTTSKVIGYLSVAIEDVRRAVIAKDVGRPELGPHGECQVYQQLVNAGDITRVRGDTSTSI